MARKRRPLSRVPGFRPAPYIEFRERMYSDVGITEDDMHVTEYDGAAYVTPPIYGKENDPIDLVQSRRPATHIAEADPHTQE